MNQAPPAIDWLRTIVLDGALSACLPRSTSEHGSNYVPFWRRAIFVAAAARVLAARLMPASVEACFAAALTADLQTLLLDLEMSGSRCSGEKDGLNQLVRALSAKLPAKEADEAAPMAEVLLLAGQCADVFINPRPAATICCLRRALRERCGMVESQVDSLLDAVSGAAADLATMFKLKLNAGTGYAAILERANPQLLEMALRQFGAQASHAATRRAARLRREGKIEITPCHPGATSDSHIARIKDLSALGLGIELQRPMNPGEQFRVCLAARPGDAPRTLVYTVTRCEKRNAYWIIGAVLGAVAEM